VAEENVIYRKDVLASEGANSDDRAVKTVNLPLPPQQEEPSKFTQQGPLTFDPSPPTKEAKDVQFSAAEEQAKLMGWHYHLGHLTFPKLKQLDLNGKIPKKLAKVLPLKCASCLFWSNDQASLARQGNQGQPQGLRCDQTCRVHLGGTNNVNGSRFL
jgi:hypothetical protein